MESKYQTLLENGTWHLYPRPSNRHVIWNKWVYKLKQKLYATVDHYKARLIAKEFEEKDVIDLNKTFSPKLATVRLC